MRQTHDPPSLDAVAQIRLCRRGRVRNIHPLHGLLALLLEQLLRLPPGILRRLLRTDLCARLRFRVQSLRFRVQPLWVGRMRVPNVLRTGVLRMRAVRLRSLWRRVQHL